MITSVPCVCACRPSIAGCPGAWRGVPVDLDVTKGRAHCGGTVISRGQRGGAISPRSLEQRTAGSRRQANSSGDIAARRLPLCACSARQTARWMSGARSRRTAQAERLPLVQEELQWRLPPSRNRTPLKGVTDGTLPANTLGLQTMEQPLTPACIESYSRLANLTILRIWSALTN